MLLEALLGESLATKLPSRPISEASGLWLAPTSSAGVDVTEDKALSLSGVFGAVRLLSQLKASLPLSVYRRQSDGGKQIALTHPAQPVLHTSPNPEMTSKQFRQALEWNRLLGGNAYGEIQWDGGGNVRGLWPLEHWRVRPDRDDQGKLFYRVDRTRKVAAADMLHVPLVSADGVSGQSFLDYAGETLGIGIAAQQYAGEFFGNGAYAGGILEHPGNPTKEARDASKEGWERMHQRKGGGGAHRVGMLWGGIKFNKDAGFADPEKTQLVNLRVFQVQEVARFLGIPPPLLAELSRATFANIEEQNLFFLTYCFTPILVDYEQEYDRKLLSPPALFSKHNVAALLRGNSKARSEFYAKMFSVGAFSVNDILELEDENPIGPNGDLHFVPVNMQTLEQAQRAATKPAPELKPPASPPPPAPAPKPAPDPNGDLRLACDLLAVESLERLRKTQSTEALRAARRAARGVCGETLRRLFTKEANAGRRAAQSGADFDAWLQEFYPRHESTLTESLGPAIALVNTLGVVTNLHGLVGLLVQESRALLCQAYDTCTRAAFELQLANWPTDRTNRALAQIFGPAEELEANPAPIVNVYNQVDVQPTPVTVENINQVDVQPAPVQVVKTDATFVFRRDAEGAIEGGDIHTQPQE